LILKHDTFAYKLFDLLLRSGYVYHPYSVDHLRFGVVRELPPVERAKDHLKVLASRHGYASRRFRPEEAAETLTSIAHEVDRYEKVYSSFADDCSRELFVNLLVFRMLGRSHVKLRADTEDYWRDYNSIDQRFRKQANTKKYWIFDLHRYEVPGTASTLSLHATPGAILNAYVLEQYRYRHTAPEIQVSPGDIVIDGGGCYGDTALYFADRVGESGRVFSFEFVAQNLEVMAENLALNPTCAAHIEVVHKALFDVSGQELSFAPDGAGTKVQAASEETTRVITTSIDDFVAQKELPRVDFIKMDIEGSELPALRGAAATLARDKPKLAIAAYHNPEDLIVLPEYLASLDLGYRLYLDHFTVHNEETVLFAVAP